LRSFSIALVSLVLGALASPACGDRALRPDGGSGAGGRGGAGESGTNGQAGTGELAGTSGQAGTGAQAGAGGQAIGCDLASPVDASTDRTVVASIRLSASTNTPQVDVVVYSDGSAERTAGPPRFDGGIRIDSKSYPAASPEVIALLCDLAAAGDVSEFPVSSGCPKSVSFGTVETINADGKTSGDVECLADTASAAAMALARDCDVLTGRR